MEDNSISAQYTADEILIKLYISIKLDGTSKEAKALAKLAAKAFKADTVSLGLEIKYDKTTKKWSHKAIREKSHSGELKQGVQETSNEVAKFLLASGKVLGKYVLHWLFKNFVKYALLTALPFLAPIVIAYEIIKNFNIQLTTTDKVHHLQIEYQAIDLVIAKVVGTLEVIFKSELLSKITEAWNNAKAWLLNKIKANKLVKYLQTRFTRLQKAAGGIKKFFIRAWKKKTTGYDPLVDEPEKVNAEYESEINTDTPLTLGRWKGDSDSMLVKAIDTVSEAETFTEENSDYETETDEGEIDN